MSGIDFNQGNPASNGADTRIKSPSVGVIQFLRADIAGDAKIIASKVRFSAIPTSSSGLSSGDVYSNAGILTIVP